MRILTDYANKNVQIYLNLLSNKSTNIKDYSNAFYQLGIELSKIIVSEFKVSKQKVILACTSEDADILAKGIVENLHSAQISLAVFWNLRFDASGIKALPASPIIKSYIENTSDSDTLIICKSIINTSCVVRTNLTYLIETAIPKNILIVAPVIYKDAEDSLKKEFPDHISKRFRFIYFAKDDKVNKKGEVIPGIGGSIYNRLGFKNLTEKNQFVPDLVLQRRKTYA